MHTYKYICFDVYIQFLPGSFLNTPHSRRPGSCDAAVTAKCLFSPSAGAWAWTLLGTDGAALPANSDPCPGDVTCILPPIPGVTYRLYGSGTESRPADAIPFGAVVQTSCSEGYEGSQMAPRNVTCGGGCSFAPAPMLCAVPPEPCNLTSQNVFID